MSTSIQDVYKVPSEKGTRSTISHVGCAETGSLNNFLLMFRGSKSNKSSNYHTKMNCGLFSSWFESKVFPEIKKTNQKSIVVLDRATYHTYLDKEDRRPTKSWTKSKLADEIHGWDGMHGDCPLSWRLKMMKARTSIEIKEDT